MWTCVSLVVITPSPYLSQGGCVLTPCWNIIALEQNHKFKLLAVVKGTRIIQVFTALRRRWILVMKCDGNVYSLYYGDAITPWLILGSQHTTLRYQGNARDIQVSIQGLPPWSRFLLFQFLLDKHSSCYVKYTHQIYTLFSLQVNLNEGFSSLSVAVMLSLDSIGNLNCAAALKTVPSLPEALLQEAMMKLDLPWLPSTHFSLVLLLFVSTWFTSYKKYTKDADCGT